MKNNLSLLTGLLLLTLTSCSKNDHTAQTSQTNNDDSSQQGTKTIVTNRMITSVTPNSIQFDTLISDLKAGDIIVSGIVDNAPSGFLRKVASVKIVNGQTIVETTNTTIQDALANTMKEGETVGRGFTFHFDAFRFADKRKASSPNVNMESRGSIAIHERYTDTSGANFTIDGKLTVTPDAGGEIYFSKQKTSDVLPKPRLDSLTYYMKVANGLTVHTKSEISSPFQKEWVVDSFPSPTAVTIWLDTIPIVLKPSITVSLGVDAGLDAKSRYDYHDSSTLSEGIEYNPADQWVLPETNEFHVIQDTGFVSSNVTGTCKIYVKIEASVTLYDAKLPTASILASPYGDLNATLDTDRIDWTIKGGVGTGASFSALPFLGNPMTDKSWGRILNIPEWTIVQGSYSVYKNNFHLEDNGVTIGCPVAAYGETGTVNGITYTKRHANEITDDNASTTCTSGITDMSGLFSNRPFNRDISSWDVSAVTDMSNMFSGDYSFNQNIGSWNVANVVNMKRMFNGASSFNQTIGSWNTGRVVEMDSMFYGASSFNQDIGGWDVSNVTNMCAMFRKASSFNQDIGKWNVANVSNIKFMFTQASSFNQDIGKWNVSKVTDLSDMFDLALAFNQNIGGWDVSNVTNMAALFGRATSFNGDIANWDVSKVTDMYAMFNGAVAFNRDIGKWKVGNVVDMLNMFAGASSFDQDLSGWCVKNFPHDPGDFSVNCPLTENHRPVWGTCPN